MSDKASYDELHKLISRLQADHRRYAFVIEHRDLNERELHYFACLCEALVSVGASVENFYKNTELP
jgi:hypothetical protein